MYKELGLLDTDSSNWISAVTMLEESDDSKNLLGSSKIDATEAQPVSAFFLTLTLNR
jgi:hypothetical protein